MYDDIVRDIKNLFERNGGSRYGGEAVTQQEHALQAAMLAELSDAGPSLILSALLHDVGHLLHDLPDNAPEDGVDDVHELLAHNWLRVHFGPEVTEPVRMHVDAKRYLCAAEAGYQESLSAASLQSLQLQGGPFNEEEAREFEQNRFFEEGIQLRRWDDLAKVVGLATPSLKHFLEYIPIVSRSAAAEEAPRRSSRIA